MTKPPHAETPDSLRATPAGASTARSSHAPAPPTIRQNGRYAVLPTEFPDKPVPAHVSVSVTASVPPVTTATPRRTRRSPPRVLFLECAGSCTCSCLLPAPAPRPTIDASQGPAPRPTIQAGQHAPAKLRRCKARALRNTTRPLPRQRSHSRLNPSEVLHSDGTTAGASTARPSHAPAPPYHPTVRTRLRVTNRTHGRPTAVTPRRRQIAQPNTGRPCASPSPSLHSTSASAWAAQTRRLPLPLERLWTFPNAAIQARATRVNSPSKKLFAPHTHRPLVDDHLIIDARPSLYAA